MGPGLVFNTGICNIYNSFEADVVSNDGFEVSPQDVVWARGGGGRTLSYSVSKFLFGEGGPLNGTALWDVVEDVCVDRTVCR